MESSTSSPSLGTSKKIPKQTTRSYSELSKTLTTTLKKPDKKKQGIFFSPPQTIEILLDKLNPYWKDIQTILEPSCGSCEFISQLEERFPGDTVTRKITGIELNSTIYDRIKTLPFTNTTQRFQLILYIVIYPEL